MVRLLGLLNACHQCLAGVEELEEFVLGILDAIGVPL